MSAYLPTLIFFQAGNTQIFIPPATIANDSCGVYSFSVRLFFRSYRPSHFVNFDFLGNVTSHIVMKFCTLTPYIKDNILQLKMGSLVNVCPSEKLRFTFLLTFLTMCRVGYPCLRGHMLVFICPNVFSRKREGGGYHQF